MFSRRAAGLIPAVSSVRTVGINPAARGRMWFSTRDERTMLDFAWLTLRQAQEALKHGRLEEAQRLLQQTTVQGHKRSFEIMRQLAQGFVERGEQHLRHDDATAAWNDLVQAEQGGMATGTVRLRQALTSLGLTQARSALEAGEPDRAAELIARLHERQVKQPELQVLEEASQGWGLARELAGRGEFAQALQSMEQVRRLLPGPLVPLKQFVNELERRQQTYTTNLVELHEAVAQSSWRDVLRLTDQILTVAPQHAEARKARSRAWQAIEPATQAVARPQGSDVQGEATVQEPPHRFLLWIDGIGGYLVCLGSRVTIGQATPENFVEVPLFADISRLHATLTRDTEGYLLEAVRAVQVNSQAVEKVLLRTGDRVTLGQNCLFQFHQPVPVSATARLEILSGHRLPLAVDGVLLMADTLVLGPGTQVHVAMPELRQPVVLFRQKDGLGVRHASSLVINGQRCQDRGRLGAGATVQGEDFAFTVEPLGARMTRI